VAEPTRSPPRSEGPPRKVAQRQSPPPRRLPPLPCSALVGLVQLFFTESLTICFKSADLKLVDNLNLNLLFGLLIQIVMNAIPGMNSNEFNMGEGGENEFIGDPQQNLIEEEDEHVNDDDDFVGRVEPEPERNDVSDEDGEDDD
ncbi:hypothetical protein S83_060745, partial [Arachis hypogaea]